MKSMTAYAEGSVQQPEGQLTWVIKSVNHRYLDCQLRLPDDFRHLETPLRQKLKDRLARGKVEANLYFTPDSGHVAQSMSLDPVLAEQLKKLLAELGQGVEERSVELMRLLHWPGMINYEQLDLAGAYEAAVNLFDRVLDDFIEARASEGQAIHEVLAQRLDGIQAQVALVRTHAPKIQAQIQNKIESKLAALNVTLDAERMEQEVALLLQKSDVEEELDRLDVHVSEVRRVMGGDEACGRRLDFLIQELNREANTLGSKATLVETSQVSVELKVLIEQLREQIQNIE